MAAKKGKGPRPSVMGSSWSSGRPTGWQDDLLGGIRDIVDTVTGKQRNPAEPEVVTRGRAATGAIVQTGVAGLDAYVAGGLAGSFGRNVVAPRAMVASPSTRSAAQSRGTGRFARDVAVTAATAAAAYGAARVAPKIVEAVAPQFRREVGIHVSETPGLSRITDREPWRNTGGMGTPSHPIRGTYRFSGRSAADNAEIPAQKLAEIANENMDWIVKNDMTGSFYVTSGRRGRVDPETLQTFDRSVNPSGYSNYDMTSRLTGPQRVVSETRVRAVHPAEIKYYPELVEQHARDLRAVAAKVNEARNAQAAYETARGYVAGRAAAGAQAIGRPNRRGRNVR